MGLRLGVDHDGNSVFRHLEPDPTAPDTLRWLADHRVPTREIHVTEDKHEVSWNQPIDRAVDARRVNGWLRVRVWSTKEPADRSPIRVTPTDPP